MLPKTARMEIAAQRGFFTADRTVGEGMLFHWKPGTEFADKPWMTIDKNGYRNASVPDGKTDVVLLGASVLAAGDVAVDLSARFKGAGISAYSLAMGSYGPFHYRDAYRRYITERNIKHRAVIVLVEFVVSAPGMASGQNAHTGATNLTKVPSCASGSKQVPITELNLLTSINSVFKRAMSFSVAGPKDRQGTGVFTR